MPVAAPSRKPHARWQLPGAMLAVVVCLVGGYFRPLEFLTAWMAAVLLPWSVSIGSLALMLIFCLTGGKWARAAWPWLTIQARLLPLIGLAFLPCLLGATSLYPWADAGYLSQFDHTENRQWFYQPAFFTGRSIFYWSVWILISWLVAGPIWQASPFWQSSEREPGIKGGQGVAGLSLVALALTVTWASIDWVMSFDPFFTSTLFGMLIGMGALLSGISAAVAAVCFWKPLRAARRDDPTLGDLANLLLAMLMLWAYFSFAQFLIMWTGDLPTEAAFYQVRNRGVWRWLTPAVAVIGLILPFFCLLSRDFKRSPRKLGSLAIGLLVIRQIEIWWMIFPSAKVPGNHHLIWAVVPTGLAVAALYALAMGWAVDRSSCQSVREVSDVS